MKKSASEVINDLEMRVAQLENKFTEEEYEIVWSVINYLYNDRPTQNICCSQSGCLNMVATMTRE